MPKLTRRPRKSHGAVSSPREDPRPHQRLANRRRAVAREEEEQEEDEEQNEDAEEDEGEDDGYDDSVVRGQSSRSRSQREREPQRKRQRRTGEHGKSQSRKSRGGDDDEMGDNDDDEDGNSGGNQEDEAERIKRTQAARTQMYQEILAKKLVRFALACEPRRVPIRRQAVKDQVLDGQGKDFRKILPVAQAQLRGIFGMELVAWPARDEATMNVRERRKVLKSQSTQPGSSHAEGSARGGTRAGAGGSAVAAAPGTAASASAAASAASRTDRYVLVSTLSEAYRASVFTPILLPKTPGNNSRQRPAGSGSGAAGLPSLLQPTPPASDAAYVGFCTFVVSLVTLAGAGGLGQDALQKYMSALYGDNRARPVRVDTDVLLPVSTAIGDYVDDDDGGGGGGESQAHSQQADGYGGAHSNATLQYLVRHGYLVRVVESAAGTGGGGGSGSLDGGNKVTWHVGPRGRLEIGPAEVAAVVRHVYGPAGGPDLEKRLKSSLRPEQAKGQTAAAAVAEDGSQR